MACVVDARAATQIWIRLRVNPFHRVCHQGTPNLRGIIRIHLTDDRTANLRAKGDGEVLPIAEEERGGAIALLRSPLGSDRVGWVAICHRTHGEREWAGEAHGGGKGCDLECRMALTIIANSRTRAV